MKALQITIRRKWGETWPAVVEPISHLESRIQGNLRLDPDRRQELLEGPSLRRYGKLLGEALFADDVRDAFGAALTQKVIFSFFVPSPVCGTCQPIGRHNLCTLILVASPDDLDSYGFSWFDPAVAVAGVLDALGDIRSDVLATVDGAAGPPLHWRRWKSNSPPGPTPSSIIRSGPRVGTGLDGRASSGAGRPMCGTPRSGRSHWRRRRAGIATRA